MAEISTGQDVATFINVFRTEPRNQQRLIERIIAAHKAVIQHRPGYISTNIHASTDGYTVIGPAYGIDCRWGLLGVIPLSGGNETRRAVEQAIQGTHGADALVNVSTDTFSQYWLVVSRHCTEVHATAVQRNP